MNELRKELDTQNQIKNDDASELSSAASKDQVMQNIQVLIRSSKKQIEEVEDTHRRLLRHQLELKKQIENLETEKKDVMDKEQIRLDDEDTDMSHARFEQQKHEIQSANYALKTSINHRSKHARF